jgi:ornithine--oxo-acid transaminase
MPSIDVAALLRTRAGEELALNDRHLNPQLGRILRTLGFDRSWRGAEGAELIDQRGDRYLDMLAGYGMFGVGRNNPNVRAQLEAALAADTANLPQLGVTLLPGLLAEQLLARAPTRRGARGSCTATTASTA